MKKKIFAITLTISLIVLSIASTTIAYFTDVDDETQEFTAGNVEIALDFTYNSAKGFPGQSVDSLAKITNTGSEDAYVGAVITFDKDVSSVLGDVAAVKAFFNDIDDYTVTYDTDNDTVYVVCEDAIANSEFVTLFNKLNIPAEWDNDDMAIFRGLKITVNAYATQTVGFDNAAQALTTAFSTDAHWGAYNTL